jgi:gamma-glutamylputrescine oxidase
MTTPSQREPSYYAATASGWVDRPALDGDVRADVCVIGGGYTGLSAALHLAQKGRKVILIEAYHVGWGASGRNGGQLHSGQRLDQETLERWLGNTAARAMFDMAEEAKRMVKDLIATHAIDCDWRDGLISTLHKRRYVTPTKAHIEHMQDEYGYEGLTWLDRDDLADRIGTARYHGGYRDASAGHLHPLNFALGLARACEAAGVKIYEETRAFSLSDGHPTRVATTSGTIIADEVIVAVNGYTSGLLPDTEARVMPIHNYILATEPLGLRGQYRIPGGEAVADSRFVVHYWRPSADGRLIFGGGESYSKDFPEDLSGFVRKHMLSVYPDLKDVRIDYAWGGTLALSVNKMPVMRRVRRGVYTSGGYTGHGVAIAVLAGKLIAEAIVGDIERFDLFAKLPAPKFPGGKWLRYPTLILAMFWYGMLDRL